MSDHRPDPPLDDFKNKLKTMPITELVALGAILKQRSQDCAQELQAIDEQILENRFHRAIMRKRRTA